MSSLAGPAPRVVRREQCADIAWRNGAGTTRVVAQDPADAAYDDFSWRVSLAQIARSGPFSSFPGVERHFVALGEHGLTLTVDGRPQALGRFDTVTFPGEAPTSCDLPAGTTASALNVMTRVGSVSAEIAVLNGATEFELAAPDHGDLLMVALEAGSVVEGVGDLPALDAVWCRDGQHLRASAVGRLLAVTLRAGGAP
ncbi:MAG TPA: HutD family protein [Pedococcus sp.]|jgi:hypothetical protein|nr:HutD family protein [Pedococcus sp.]